MTGIERLQEMIAGQEDAALKQVVDYLCTRKDLSDKYLNPEKDLSGMASYIKDKARVNAKNGWNFLNDKVVYSWAVTYFLFSDSSLGIKKPEVKKQTKKNKDKESKTVEKSTNNNNVIDINTAKSKTQKPSVEQITLFGGEL